MGLSKNIRKPPDIAKYKAEGKTLRLDDVLEYKKDEEIRKAAAAAIFELKKSELDPDELYVLDIHYNGP
jgi:hypothetical protein